MMYKGKIKHYRPDNKCKWIKLSFLIAVKFLYRTQYRENIKRPKKLK